MKEFSSREEKLQQTKQLKNALDALPAKISAINYFEVGINDADSPRALDMVLTSHFNSIDELEKYRVHPEHVKVLAMVKEITEYTVVVDYK
ncbi:MAG: Dabb family protein [Bacteroidales bacterium]|nr:Dabb family protein [Bacteroidales bacterium]MCF8457111.1 Dabb family protein [Bacteroidales bacterium]